MWKNRTISQKWQIKVCVETVKEHDNDCNGLVYTTLYFSLNSKWTFVWKQGVLNQTTKTSTNFFLKSVFRSWNKYFRSLQVVERLSSCKTLVSHIALIEDYQNIFIFPISVDAAYTYMQIVTSQITPKTSSNYFFCFWVYKLKASLRRHGGICLIFLVARNLNRYRLS